MRFWLTSPRASSLFLFFALVFKVSAADTPTPDDPDTPENHDPPCTVTSPHSGNFFDLRPLTRTPGKTPLHTDWLAKGLDYNSNFTINICAPVLADTSDVEGIEGEARKNVSAFYDKDGERYSIGWVRFCPTRNVSDCELTRAGAYQQTPTFEAASSSSNTQMGRHVPMPQSSRNRLSCRSCVTARCSRKRLSPLLVRRMIAPISSRSGLRRHAPRLRRKRLDPSVFSGLCKICFIHHTRKTY